MQFGNCPVCGKLYAKNASGMCPECFKQEEENERIVADYIRDHRRCSIEEVHIATGIAERTIYRMIKSGRVQECDDVSYPCEGCGKQITRGRLCKSCMDKFTADAGRVTSSIKEGMAEAANRKSHGMYTKDM